MRLTLFVSLTLFLAPLLAEAADTSMLTVAQRKSSEGDPEFTTAGLFSTQQGTSAHFEVVRFRDAHYGDTWASEFGVGYLLPTQIPLFMGGGVVAGRRQDSKSWFSTWYPEAGVVIPLLPGIAVTATQKRYMRLHQQHEDVLMFGVAFTMK